MFEITFTGKEGLFELTEEFTAYPGEGEVLIQDGLEYKIIDNEVKMTSNTNKEFRLIKLQYPAKN